MSSESESNSRDQLLSALSNLKVKFSGDRSKWNETKLNILCYAAEEELALYLKRPLVPVPSSGAARDLANRLDESAVPGSSSSSSSSSSSYDSPSILYATAENKKKAYKAWAIIMKRLTEAPLIMAQQCMEGDAYAVWRKLCDEYEAPNLNVVYAIKAEIDNTRLKPNESIDSYRAKLDLNFMRLGNMIVRNANGELTQPYACSELDKIYIFKRGIDGSMCSFSSVKATLNQSEKTYNEVCSAFKNWQLEHLSEIKNRLSQRNQNDVQDDEANFSRNVDESRTNRRDQRGDRNGRDKGTAKSDSGNSNTCYCCGKSGHVKKNCYMREKKCNLCNRVGHISTVCRAKDRQNKSRSSNGESSERSYFATSDDEEEDQSNMSELVFSTCSINRQMDDLVLDSGATHHMVKSKKHLSNVKECTDRSIRTANGAIMPVAKMGEMKVQNVKLTEVAFVPTATVNLISVQQLSEEGCSVVFDKTKATVFNSSKKELMVFPKRGKLYVCDPSDHGHENASAFSGEVSDSTSTKLLLWHRKFGHASMKVLRKMIRNGAVKGMELSLLQLPVDHKLNCEVCIRGKSHRQSHSKTRPEHYKASEVLDCVHSDLSGKVHVPEGQEVPIKSVQSIKYVLTIIDEFSRKLFVFLLRKKSDAESEIMNWVKKVQNAKGHKVKQFHSDHGGEFTSKELATFWKENGTEMTTVPANTPHLNNFAERVQRTFFEKARCMLIESGLPIGFWVYAILCACFVYNCTSHSSLEDITPFESWYKIKPDVNKLRVFGCDAYVHVQKEDRHKMEDKAKKGIFIGYELNRMAYQVFDPNTERIIISRDVDFDELNFTAAKAYAKSRGTVAMDMPIFGGSQLDVSDFELKRKKEMMQSSSQSKSKSKSHQGEQHVRFQVPERRSLTNAIESALKPHEELKEVEFDIRNEQVDNEDESKYNEPSEPTNTWNEIESKEEADSKSESESEPEQQRQSHAGNYRDNTRELMAERAAALNRPLTAKEKDQISHRSGNIGPQNIVEGKRTKTVIQLDEAMLIIESIGGEPTSVEEALASSEGKLWKQAMIDQMKSLKANKTWKEMPCPPGVKIVKCKWVFKRKIGANGKVIKYKARLVACGYSQTEGVDFNETYAPVGKYKSIRIILAIVAQLGYVMEQMDVDSAFLNATVKEEIYMQQPPGFEKQGNIICLLIKALYGIKQAPAEWNHEFNGTIVSHGFKRCTSDSCVYMKMSKTNRQIIIFLFVDDIIIAVHPEDKPEWKEIQSAITLKYKIVDLGQCKWILQMGIEYSPNGSIKLNQEVYVNKLLQKFQLDKCNQVSIPGTQDKLTEGDSDKDSIKDEAVSKLYSQIVGSLLYGSISTRPDISYMTGILTRYMSSATNQHLTAAKRVLRYLAGTTKLGLVYESNGEANLGVEAYVDADFANEKDRKSITGYVVKVNGCVVSWSSKKQSRVATSTAEAEYIALSSVGKEVMWTRALLKELGFNQDEPSIIHCDNQSAIKISEHDAMHEKSKHFDITLHWIREAIHNKEFLVKYIPTKYQQADVLTKSVPRVQFQTLRDELMG
jgi:hypothetical protein